MSKSTTKKWAIGTFIAAIAGYVAGILTAPKSGKETRKDIKEGVEHGVAEAEKTLKKLHTQLSDLTAEAKEKATTLKGVAQKDLQVALDKTTVVREKAREMLGAIHEGNKVEDKDLRKAIDDANKAIDHLKTYLKKK
ncbi:MAG TPA: YtxH domain-containing protein [Candidatus Saccharimonadales bacterium]|nr:YtxH domain-containing protein [Candidatus Saccharimonadales bacterium]